MSSLKSDAEFLKILCLNSLKQNNLYLYLKILKICSKTYCSGDKRSSSALPPQNQIAR